jgi:hypothetical protein
MSQPVSVSTWRSNRAARSTPSTTRMPMRPRSGGTMAGVECLVHGEEPNNELAASDDVLAASILQAPGFCGEYVCTIEAAHNRRSQVQILPPLLQKALLDRAFCRSWVSTLVLTFARFWPTPPRTRASYRAECARARRPGCLLGPDICPWTQIEFASVAALPRPVRRTHLRIPGFPCELSEVSALLRRSPQQVRGLNDAL